MTTLNKMERLMEKKQLNKRQLSIQSDIPYSTLDNLWKRGSDSMRLPTFMKLCDFFNVTMDSMAYDDREIEYRVDERSDFNKRLARAYFEHPDQQSSVLKLLDLEMTEAERGRKEA